MSEQPGKRLHYGWLIVIGLMCNALCIWQLTGSLSSIFALPVSSAMGVARSQFFLWMTCYALTYTVCAPIWGNLIQNEKININVLMTVGILAVVAGLVIFATAQSIEMLWLGGIVMGTCIPGVDNICYSYFCSNWIADSRRGTVLGAINAMLGVGGFVWPIVVQAIVGAAGWQMGYWFCAIAIAVLCLPWAIFVYRRKPEDKGLMPIGYVEGEATKKKESLIQGIDFKKAIKTPAFYFIFFSMLLLSILGGFKSNFSGIALENLGAIMEQADIAILAATMLSVQAAADLVGNLLMGPMIDKVGVKIPTFVFLVIAACFFVITIFFGGSVVGLYVAAVCFGLHTSVLRNALPLVTREMYGPKDYGRIYGFIAAAKGLMGGFASTLVALFYDTTGSYGSSLMVGLAIVIIATVLVALTFTQSNKYHWRDGDAAAA